MSTTEGFAHPEFLIETEALERRLGEPGLRIFDRTTNLIPDPKTTYQAVPARAEFEKGHIPGAQFIDLQADLSDNSQRLRFMLPAAAAFAAAMSRFGVGSSPSTMPRCSTAVGRSGAVRGGRSRPARPRSGRPEISSSASRGH